MTADLLRHEAIAMIVLPAAVINATDIGSHAVEYALNHWKIFPLRGKVPAIRGGNGVLDATDDIAQVIQWWSGDYRGCNIGGQVPENLFVLDIDPRHGGLATLVNQGPLTQTLTTVSGRGDGGVHLFYRRPPGKLTAANLGPGIDLKTSSGYVVLPPSRHPDTGRPYIRIEHPIAAPPRWLVDLITEPKTVQPITPPRRQSRLTGHLAGSIVDEFNANTSWSDVLMPHGWACRAIDPDGEGAIWLHPTHTSNCSATIWSDGRLYVYSTNTVFEVTEPGSPRGYSKFDTYALLNFRGDMTAAAQAIRGGR